MTVERTHSTWFHFTKEPKYFAAVDEIREEQTWKPQGRNSPEDFHVNEGARRYHTNGREEWNPLGKLPGSVWSMDTQACLERLVKGWSPSGICTECGEGRRPVVSKSANGRKEDPTNWSESHSYHAPVLGRGVLAQQGFQRDVTATIIGYACACPEPTAPTKPPSILISGFDAFPLVTTP